MASKTRSPYLIFAIVALALLMSSLDTTAVVVALPTLVTELDTTLAWAGWTLTGYQLAFTVMMPIAGKLSDDLGRKRLFMIAAIVFTGSSLACSLAPNIYVLIVFRVLQGLGGGVFLPCATGIVSDAFGDRRATAIGLFTSIFPLGGVLGPSIGGIIIDSLSWQWIFFINVPLGVALIALGFIFLPNTSPSENRRSIDWAGVGLFAAGTVTILYAITTWANNPEASGHPLIWILFVTGFALLAIFLKHESRIEAPLIEIDLLKRRPFLAANLYNLIHGAVVFGFYSFIPYYAFVAYNMSAAESGIILSPRSLIMAATSALSSFFLIQLGYRKPMIIGVLLLSASLALLGPSFRNVWLIGIPIPDILLLATIMCVGAVGMGISGPAANNAALDLVPNKVAAIAGMRGMFRSTGGVLGTALIILALSHFEDKAGGLQTIFVALSVVILVLIPLVFLIPDTAKAKHDDGKEAGHAPHQTVTAEAGRNPR